jgi:hypothetical protein
MHRARAARPRAFDSLPFLDPDPGRCRSYSSAGSSKIKVRTSSRHKAQLALLHDEVRILIFDDPAELEKSQRPGSGSGEGKLPNPRGRAARERCMKFVSKIYEIPRATVARAPCASSVPVKLTVALIKLENCFAKL